MPFPNRSAGVSPLLEAGAAVYRLVLGRLEGEFRFTAALAAYSIEILSGRLVCVLLRVTAGFASLGLVCVSLFGIKCLLAGCENKFIAAFNAYQSLVLILYRSSFGSFSFNISPNISFRCFDISFDFYTISL